MHGTEDPQPHKIPLKFFRTASGVEPVREWLRSLDEVDRHAIGKDLLRAQWRWPAGMPLCRPLRDGLWEIRTNIASRRTARVMLCLFRGNLVVLHGFVTKTRKTAPAVLVLALKRQRELER